MKQPARFSAIAQREFASVLRDLQPASAAERLKRLVNEFAIRVGQHPAIGRQELALADKRYRFWSVPGFPYLIVYRADASPPTIVRFVHTSRDLPRLLSTLRPH